MPKDIKQLKKKQTKIREKADENKRKSNEYWEKKRIKAINFIKSQKGRGVTREEVRSHVFSFWDVFSSHSTQEAWWISNSHFEKSLGHQRPETAKKDKSAIVFLKKYVTFISYITLIICIMRG